MHIRSSENVTVKGEVIDSIGSYATVAFDRAATIRGSVGSTVNINSAHALVFESSVGSYSSIECTGATIRGSVGSTVNIKSASSITLGSTLGSYSTVDCTKGIFHGDIGSTVTINSRDSLTVHSAIGSYSQITCKGNALFKGRLGSNVSVKSNSTLTFEDDIGSYCTVDCKGSPIFKGDVGSNVNITCDGKPTFMGAVGSYTQINGKAYGESAATSSSRSTTMAPTSIRAINGIVTITCNGITASFPGLNISNINGQFLIDGRPIPADTFIAPPPIAASSASSSSAYPEGEDDDVKSAIAESLRMMALAPRATSAVAEKKLTVEETFISKCSAYTRSYINNMQDKKRYTEIINELKLTSEESLLLKNVLDPISLDVMNIPLRLNDQVLDLKTIVGCNGIDPYNRYTFVPENVSPSRETITAIDDIIKLILEKRKRETAALALSTAAPLVAPPGGLAIPYEPGSSFPLSGAMFVTKMGGEKKFDTLEASNSVSPKGPNT